MFPIRRTAAAAAVLGALAAGGGAQAAPAPCNGTPQITDVENDGHHQNEDVTSAWFSEESGHLQAVIKVRQAVWESQHEDDPAGAAWSFFFTAGGATQYVRLRASQTAVLSYDYGTWTSGGGFASAGSTTGVVAAGTGGTVTFDVPAATGATAGKVLTDPFVLTSDGTDGSSPHWVDRGPGGTTPGEDVYGADYVVGSCTGGNPTPTPTPDPNATPTPGGTPGPGGGTQTTTGVVLDAPARVVGGGTIKVGGRVSPARGGVPVDLSTETRTTATKRITTATDGTFSTNLEIKETSKLRAAAEGIRSSVVVVTVQSRTRLKIRRLANGKVRVSGTVRPALPGRVQLLRTTSARPAAKTAARKGRFSIRLSNPRRGRYQAVFIPSGARAERSTSNIGVIR